MEVYISTFGIGRPRSGLAKPISGLSGVKSRLVRSPHAGHQQRRDRAASRRRQAFRCREQGRAGGHHIIDQNHWPYVKPRAPVLPYGECPGDIAVPRQFSGLVLLLAEIALPVTRHRNHRTVLAIRHHRKVPCHQRCQERGQLQPVAMFEGQDQLARDVVIMEASPDHRQLRRVHPAGGAYGFGQCLAKRQAAALADRRADGGEAAQACGAQAGEIACRACD